jgi:hypothetical protein
VRRALAAAVVLASCGGSAPCARNFDELCVEDASGAALQVDDAAELRRMLDVGLELWRGSEAELAGWSLRLESEPLDCGGFTAMGCTYDERHEVDLYTRVHPDCPYAALVHELGHALLYTRTGDGDRAHRDPRFARANRLGGTCARGGDEELDAP